MKVKIITNEDNMELEKEINKFIKKKKVVHIDVKETPIRVLENTLTNHEKVKYHENKYLATIIYEE